MSDIHGQYSLFLKMLKIIKFSENDILYVLGDVIDRGPDGIACLQEIMKRKNIKMLLGNHEHMMLTVFDENYRIRNSEGFDSHDVYLLWYKNGCQPTVSSFNKLPEEEQKELLKFIKNIPVNIEVTVNNKDFLLTHAAPLPKYFDRDLSEHYRYSNDTEFAVWCRRFHHSDIGKTVIYGHTPTSYFQNYKPLRIYKEKGSNYIDIDCGCAYITNKNHKGGRLGCIRLDDMKNFYSEYRI